MLYLTEIVRRFQRNTQHLPTSIFNQLYSLRSINIEGNNLSYLPNNLFKNQRNLDETILSGENLDNIQYNFLQGLRQKKIIIDIN